MSILTKMKGFMTELFGIKEYKLNGEGRLDVSADDYARITENYGADFVAKFEKMLGDESNASPADTGSGAPVETQTKTDMNLTLLCALLAVNAISLVDGKATLSEEQLNTIEAGLKKLQDEKTAAETALTAAQTEKVNAVNELTEASADLNDLDDSVAEAGTIKEKVEAVRKKLASKPGAAATQAQTSGDKTRKAIEGADEVNQYVDEIL
jgi:hypothetical protein